MLDVLSAPSEIRHWTRLNLPTFASALRSSSSLVRTFRQSGFVEMSLANGEDRRRILQLSSFSTRVFDASWCRLLGAQLKASRESLAFFSSLAPHLLFLICCSSSVASHLSLLTCVIDSLFHRRSSQTRLDRVQAQAKLSWTWGFQWNVSQTQSF